MKLTTIRWPPDLYAQIREAAREDDRTAAELVRHAMREYVRAHLTPTGTGRG
jgi:predicted transcriptional regulator